MTDLVIVAIIIICVYIIPASATCALMHWITHRGIGTMISKKKLIQYFEEWKGSLGFTPLEEAAKIFIKAVIDKIRVFPEEDVTDINTGNKWIPVSERLPENEEEVEISCIGRYIGAGDEKKECYFTARAFHVDGTLTTEDSNFVWNDIETWEYNEEEDAYIIPEGWWEYVTFSEEFGAVDAEVVAWRPIAEPYKGE